MKKLYASVIVALIFLSTASFGQTAVTEDFEHGGALPTGWTNSIVSGSYNFVVTNASLVNPASSAHSGSYWTGFNCWYAPSGSSSILVTPVIDWSARGGVATTVTAWMNRDLTICAGTNDRIQVWVNTAPNLTGATSLGVVPRRGDIAISGTVTGTSTVGTTGWYQYTFTIPTTFNTATNYIIFNGLSAYGASVYMDDVAYTTYTCTAPVGGAITGNSPVCVGATRALANATGTAGGTWSSSNTAAATVNAATGVVTGAGPGTSTITYSATACSITATATTVVTVNAVPSAISGSLLACPGGTLSLTNTVSGGTWSTSNGAIATVGTAGLVTGVSIGTATITYNLGNGCSVALASVTVNSLPSAIGGSAVVCAGLNTTLTDATSGGTWSSSNPALGSIASSTGILTGIASGNPTITYTVAGAGCIATKTATVNAAAPITGGTSMCIGYTTTLSNATTGGGTWFSANTGIATINSSGVATSVSVGSTTISFTSTLTGCVASQALNVTNAPSAFTVTGSGAYCAGGTGVVVGLNSSEAGVAYSLYNGATLMGIVTGTGAALSFGNQLAGTYTSIANYGTPCAATMLGSVTVSINPLPAVFAVTGGGNYCLGGTGSAVGLTSSAIGVNYQLYRGGTIPVGSPVAGTSGTLNFGLQTTTGTYTVGAINITTLCASNMSGSVIIGTNPLPTAYTVTGTAGYCTGGAGTPVGLSSSDIGTNYTLFIGGVPISGFIAGTGSAITFGNQTTSGTYTIKGTNSVTGCINNMSGSAIVTINPLPATFSVTGGGAYCTGPTGVAVGLGGSESGVSYQLKNGSTLVGASVPGAGTSISFGLQTLVGAYTVVATNSISGCSNNMTGSVLVSVNPLPSIFTVTGGGSYCVGGSGVPVTLGGSTAGVNYQLYNGSTLIGAAPGTGSSISFGNQTSAGSYSVVATNTTTSCTSNMSGTATVVVNTLPTVFTMTLSGPSSTYCAGGAGVTLGLSGSTVGVNYQLFNGGLPVVGSTGLVAGTGAAISFGAWTPAGSYTVVATNASTTCTSNMAGSFLIAINPLPTVYSLTGGGAYCAGTTGVTIGLSLSNVGISYQLYNQTGPAGSPVAGTGAAISFGLQTTSSLRDSVIATNLATGCSVNMSGNVPVAISALPTANNISGGGSYCAGGTGVSIILNSSSTGVNYQLVNGVGSPVGAPLAGTGAALTYNSVTAAGTYTIVGINTATSCSNNMTGSATVVINALPSVSVVSGGGSYCSGSAAPHVIVTPSISGINYQLFNGAVPAGTPVPGTGLALDMGAWTTPGTYTVVARNPATTCQSNMSGSVNISVNPLPTAYPITQSGASYCTGGTGVSIGLSNSSTGTTYQLYNLGVITGAPVSGTGFAIDFGLHLGSASYTVRATNSLTGCIATMTGTAVVFENALPAAHNVVNGGSYCPGGSGVIIGLDASNAGISYQLYNGSTIMGAPVPGASGLPISFGLQTATGNYTVVATNTSTSCFSNMTGSANVAIYPLPTVYIVTGGGNYCIGGAGSNVGLSNSSSNVNYQLYAASAPIGAPTPGTGLPLDFGPQAITGTYTVVATSTITSCFNNMAGSAVVNTNPLPTAYSVTGGGNYCTGGPGIALGIDGSDAGTSYHLLLGGSPVGSTMAGSGGPVSFGMQTAGGNYTVLATNTLTGCNQLMTGIAVVGTNTPPTATYTVNGTASYCIGTSGRDVTLSGSDNTANYQLFNGSTSVGFPMPGTGGSLDFGLQTAGIYTVQATNTANTCSSNMTGSAIITVSTLPTPYIVSGGGNYCAGGAGVHILLSGSNTGINYELYNTGVPTGMIYAGTGSGLDFGLILGAGAYTVVATAGSGAGCTNNMLGTATVGMNPLPAAHSAISSSSSYCAGGTGVSITLDGSDAGINYQLFYGASPEGTSSGGTGGPVVFSSVTMIGSYHVVATNAITGCKADMTPSITVNISSLPTVFAVTGGGQFCMGGAGVHIGLSNANAGVNYQLYRSGVPAGVAVTGVGTAIDFGLMTDAGTYVAIATNNTTGCTNAMSGSASVTVNALPVSYVVTGGGNYCSGGTGVAIGLAGSAIGNSYQLMRGTTPSGAAIAGTGTGISFGLTTIAGTYTVHATSTVTGCSSLMTGSEIVDINSLPTAYPVSGGGNYCPGGTGVNVGISNSASGVTYQLYNGGVSTGAGIGGVAGTSINFGLMTAAGTYTVMASDNITGCTNTMSGSAAITVNPLPAVYGVVGGGNICAGGTGVHVGLMGSNAGVNYGLYIGTVPMGSLPGTGGPLDFGFQTTGGTYMVQAINATTGCSVYMSGSAVVNVNPVVTPLVTVNSSAGDTVCGGNFVTFNALTVNGGSTPAYIWTINGVVVSTGGSYGYLPSNGDVVGVMLTSSAACAMPAVTSSSLVMTVDPKQLPVVVASLTPGTEICSGTLVTFTAIPSWGGTAPTYSWIRNGAAGSSTSSSFSYVAADGDNVYVVMTSNYHCRLTNTASSAHTIMKVDAPVLPVVAINAEPGNNVAAGQTVTLIASIANGGPAPTIQWLLNGVAVPGAIGLSYTNSNFVDGDSITCQVLSSGGCQGLLGFNSITMHVANVGVKPVSLSGSNLMLIPNPNKGQFTIKGTLGVNTDEAVTVEVVNMLGQVILSQKVTARNGELNEHIQLLTAPANGMYILNLRTGAENKTFHFVIEQ